MIKGILFDKDGTLIDFFSLWLGAAKAVVIQFLKENELSEEVEGTCVLCYGNREWRNRSLWRACV